jgi:hypothetical protein
VCGGAAALAVVTMAATNIDQLKEAAEETMVVVMVTGSRNDCNCGDDGSADDGGSDDGGCGDGDGNTDSGSGSVDGDSNRGDCNSNGIVAVARVEAMAAVMAATTAATAMAGSTDNNQLKGAWMK